jgi:prepilin-type processing-associated H-X9-DG protein
MSGHDMAPENWPPGPGNTTGVGLQWDARNEVKLLGSETTNIDDLALVKFSMLPDPADILLLTEYPDVQNRMGSLEGITVSSVSQQGSPISNNWPKLLHYGRFNYLMADGHVEMLTGLQTGGMNGHAGIWSIKEDD